MKKLFTEIPYLQEGNVVLRQITEEDAGALQEFVRSDPVYKYLPTFLFERKYEDIHEVIARLYTECFEESIILGIFEDGHFCGLAEMYGYRDPIHKISLGGRLLTQCQGRGIGTKALRLMVEYLYTETDIEIITASSMIENKASANLLEKNGFSLVCSGVPEDWGYEEPVPADKWIR